MTFFRFQLLFVAFLTSCLFKNTNDHSLKWEHARCLDNEVQFTKYIYDPSILRIPIFPRDIQRRVIDSLCFEFLNDFTGDGGIPTSGSSNVFRNYYYRDSSVILAITEINLLVGERASFKCFLDLAENEISEHSSWQMIYVPDLGIIYAMMPESENPKAARLVKHYKFPKKKWKEKYHQIVQPYLLLDCFTK